MKDKRIVSPGPGHTLVGEYGEKLIPPPDWAFLPAGDAGVTRKVTAKGTYWRVQVKKGKRLISKGIWAPKVTIHEAQQTVSATRNTEDYQKKRAYELQRREKKQNEYEIEFCSEVEKYLNFHPQYLPIAKAMAKMITDHAIPVGSGTVARTSMIPIEDRAGKAVIAWMRHQTTAYDNLNIPKIKGERRAVRRLLAEQSVKVLAKYRKGETIQPTCPLFKAIHKHIKAQ